MKKVLSFLLGDNQDTRMIILILTPPLFFSIFILVSHTIDIKTLVTALLAFDIFAGLLSNMQEKTHLAWRNVSKSKHIAFIITHLTIYPLLVVLFNVSLPLMVFMLAMLLTKTCAFAIGHKEV